MNPLPHRLALDASIRSGQRAPTTMLRCASASALLLIVVSNLAEAEAPKFDARGVDFLKKHCLDCHGNDSPEADLNLQAMATSRAWIEHRKTSDRVMDALRFGLMPPEGQARPTVEELEQFTDLVESILGHADRNSPPNPGRVTMRRLNRNEYRRTIRDLFQVDFDAAEDFPSDDVGHGFDNIGDVLTLPPVLMERYLAAAENISRQVLTPHPPKPPKRHIAARYCEPAGRDVPTSKFRPLTNEPDQPGIRSGPMFTRYKIPGGEYMFRAKVYTDAGADRDVHVAVLACSPTLPPESATPLDSSKLSGAALKGLWPFKVVARVKVTARSEQEAQLIEIPIVAMPGMDRTAIALESAKAGEHCQVFIDGLALEGPSDTRPPSHRAIMSCSAGKSHADQTREITGRLATRAYRRPATPQEIEGLTDLVLTAEAGGMNWEEAMQLAVQAVLVSPKFLFRVELDEQLGGPARPLDEHQLASRLSYFLWSSMPDDELLSLAGEGKLSRQLPQQARRMLADARSEALISNFASQWLQIKRLEKHAPDNKLFPNFNDPLRRAMMEETQRFFGAIVREDRSIQDLLVADFTFLNEPLAKHYGILDTKGNRSDTKPQVAGGSRFRGEPFVRVELQDRQRGGLLTQASILTVTSNPTRTSPVKRGRWVLEQLLGTPPPPPPPNVPELDDDGKQLTGTLRERLEQHRANPACANCHARMDPMGFALEQYDAVGRFRDKDEGGPIDPSGALPGGGEAGKFSGAAELAQRLQELRSEQFKRCLTEKLLIYALGRGLEYYDRPAINKIVQNLAEKDNRFSSLVVEIVTSTPFKLRGGE